MAKPCKNVEKYDNEDRETWDNEKIAKKYGRLRQSDRIEESSEGRSTIFGSLLSRV